MGQNQYPGQIKVVASAGTSMSALTSYPLSGAPMCRMILRTGRLNAIEFEAESF